MPHGNPPSDAEIVETWISYHIWLASRPPRDNSPVALREEDAEAHRQGFWAWEASPQAEAPARAPCGRGSP